MKQPEKFALSQQSTNLNSKKHWIFSKILKSLCTKAQRNDLTRCTKK